MGWVRKWLRRRKTKRLVTELAQLGFYRYMSAEKSAEVQADVVSHAMYGVFPGLFDGTGRLCDAHFKESPYPGWLKEYTGIILPAVGVQLPSSWEDAAEYRSGGLVRLTVGERSWQEEYTPADDDEYEWDLAERRLLLVVLNELLKEAGSEERAWHAWGEKHESLYIVMTPNQHRTVTSSGIVPDLISPTVLP